MKIIILILAITSCSAFAETRPYTCIERGERIAPKPITDEWKQQHYTTWTRRQVWNCCANLVLNTTTGVCEDKSLVDERFKFCQNHSECTGKLGCFMQDTSELYTTESMDPVEIAYWKKQRDIFDKQQATLERPEQNIGDFCYRNMECRSYRCDRFRCAPQNICRHSHEGDVAPPYVKRFLHPLPPPSTAP